MTLSYDSVKSGPRSALVTRVTDTISAMSALRSACLCVGLVLGMAPVVAQPGQPAIPPSPPVPPTPAEVEVPPPDPEPTPSAADYQAGYQLLLAGDFAAAAARLREVAARAVDPELRGAARALADLADAYAAKQARILFGAAAVAAASGDEDPNDGRTSFVVSTTVASIYTGVVAIDLLDADVRGGAAVLLGATALGLTGSLFGTRGRRISGGAAEAYSTGMLVGLANGLLLAEPLGADGSEPFQVAALGGLALGGATGLLYGDRVQPTRGQMSFVGTLATLGFATAGLGLVVTAPDIEADTVLITMAAGIDLGAAAGLVLGRDLTWSSGRARLVWLGALVGGLGGLGGSLLVAGDDVGGRSTAGATLAGTWGGFALATYLTRDMRPDRRFLGAPPAVVLAPLAVPRGAGFGLTGDF